MDLTPEELLQKQRDGKKVPTEDDPFARKVGRPCTICEHKDVKEINNQLLRRHPITAIARLFPGTKVRSIQRHKRNHLRREIKASIAAIERQRELTGLETEDRLDQADQYFLNIMAKAMKDGEHQASLRAAEGYVEITKFRAELRKEIESRSPKLQVIVNALESPGWLQLRDGLIKVLVNVNDRQASDMAAMVEVGERIRAALERTGQTELVAELDLVLKYQRAFPSSLEAVREYLFRKPAEPTHQPALVEGEVVSTHVSPADPTAG